MTAHKLFAILAAALAGAAVIPGIGAIPALVLGIAGGAAAGVSAITAHSNDKTAAVNAAVAGAAAAALQKLPADHPATAIIKGIVAAEADDTSAAV